MEKAYERGRPTRTFLLTKQDIVGLIISAFGFFAGRVVVFQFLSPVAVAYLSALGFCGGRFYVVCIMAALGMATKLQGPFLLKYYLCMIMMAGAQWVLRKRLAGEVRQSVLFQACYGGIAALISGLVLAVWNGYSLYFGMMALLEGALVFSLTYVFKRAVAVMTATRRRKALSPEEIIGLAVLMSCIIGGAADIHIAQVSLKYLLCTTVLLVVAYKGGCALGAMAGMLLGLMLFAIGYGSPELMGVLSLAAMAGAVPRAKGRLYSIGAFALGGAMAVLLLDRAMFGWELLYSVALGAGAYLLLPSNFYFNISSSIDTSADSTDEYVTRLKEMTYDRLKDFAEAFDKLARTFRGLTEKKNALLQQDISGLIDEAAARICEDCPHQQKCWDEDFYNTYQAVFNILDGCEKKGKIEMAAIAPSFKNNCIRLGAFTTNLARIFELYKTNLAWNHRIGESRALVSQQLAGMAKTVDGLAGELVQAMQFDEDLGDKIQAELLRNKIEVENVIVLENTQGRYEVSLHRGGIWKKAEDWERASLAVVEKILGRSMKKQDDHVDTLRNRLRVKLVEREKYRLTSAVAKETKTGEAESGDSFSFMELKNGQCLLALSDGMGSGKKAREESAAAVGLLEDFIESGFDKEIAVKIINSALVLKSGEERFSTLDICSLDLYTGEAEFIKIGAATTFIKRDGVVQTVKSSTLPIGILNEVDVDVSIKNMRHNDLIVMVTDGITDAMGAFDEKENWVAASLRGFKGSNPQDVADFLLMQAKAISGKTLKDDMTVMAARVWDRN